MASRARSLPPQSEESLVAKAAADTLAWLNRTEQLILAKQRHYLSRMRELQLERMLPTTERCHKREAWAKKVAKQQLKDIRELMAMMRDTLDQIPPQLLGATPAEAMASASSSVLEDAVAFVDGLAALPGGVDADCPVCLTELRPGEDRDVVALGCGGGTHCFHRSCIRDWAKLSARCPLCRDTFGVRGPATVAACVREGTSPQSHTVCPSNSRGHESPTAVPQSATRKPSPAKGAERCRQPTRAPDSRPPSHQALRLRPRANSEQRVRPAFPKLHGPSLGVVGREIIRDSPGAQAAPAARLVLRRPPSGASSRRPRASPAQQCRQLTPRQCSI